MRFFGFLVMFLSSLSVLAQKDLKVIIQTGHAGKINSFVYVANNTKLVTAGKDAKLVLWDLKTGKQEKELIAHKGSINKIDIYDPTTLVTCSDDSTVKLIDLTTFQVDTTIAHFDAKVKAVSVNQINKNIAVGSKFLHLVNNKYEITTLKAMSFDHFDAIHYLDSMGCIAYGGRKDKFLRVIEEHSLDIVKSLQMNCTSIHSQNNEIVVGGLYGVVYYFNFENLQEKRYSMPNPLVVINEVGIHQDKILIARSDGIVEQINKKDFNTFGYYKGHLTEVTGAKFDSNGYNFASSDSDGNILLWNGRSKKMTKLIKGESNPINVAKFSQSQDELLIGYANGILRKINLISNNVVSNRLYFSELQKLNGWKYSIISLDEQIDQKQYFKVLKIKTFDENTQQLAFCEIWKGEWDLQKNQIKLLKQILKSESKKLIADQSVGKKITWQTYFLNKENLETFNKNFICKSGVLKCVDSTKDKTVNQSKTLHSDRVTGIAFNAKFNVLISYSWDGSIQFWHAEKLIPTCKLYLTGQRDFLWLNEQSYYYSSKGALENVAFSWQGQVFPFDQFDIKYNRPDLIYTSLPFLDETIVDAMKKAYEKRLSKLGVRLEELKISNELPQVEVTLPNEAIEFFETIELKIKAQDNTSSIKSVSVYVNGVPYQRITNKQADKGTFSITSEVALTAGDNYIEVYATNAKGIKSLKESFSIESKRKYEKPDLYLVSIGISNYQEAKYNLNYAAKDANDMINQLRKSRIYDKIHTVQLIDSSATQNNISQLTEFLNQADYKDVVIVFAAGHGILNENLDYFFAPHDMNFENPGRAGISFEAFQDVMSHTKSRNKLLLLDACHSGEIDKEEVEINTDTEQESDTISFRAVGRAISLKDGEKISPFELSRMLFADMRESNGATVISSASGTEFAIEGNDWKNGVFSYCFMNGISTKEADLNRDGEILLSEMQTYLNVKVIELTNGKQNPNSRVENLKSDFRIW